MKKIFAALGIVTFAVVGCDDSSSASSNDNPGVESSSSEAVFSSSSSEQFFVPSEYRTCDKKYEGKFLLHQYDLWYYNDKSHEEVEKIVDEFYKCEKGKWSGPLDSAPGNETGGDVIRVAPDDWECDAENEGVVKPWKFYVCSGARIWGYTPARYARCEQGDWVVCEAPSSSSSSALLSSSVTSESSSSVNDASSSSVKSESSSSVENPQSSSSEVTRESSSSVSEVSSSSLKDFDWSLPKETYLNPAIEYDSFIDSRDGKVYRTVKIGEQTWMAENLNYYDDSDLSVKEKSWCYGKNDNGDSTTCDVAGRLYTWAAAIDSARLYADKSLVCGYGIACALPDTVYGICPSGWHLPNKAEWEALFSAVDGKSTAGTVLKSQMGWTKNGNGTDAFGFSALPVGFRADNNQFYGDDEDAYFWSSTMKMDVRNTPYSMSVYYDEKSAYMNFDMKFSFSVRCLKNN